MIKVLSDWKKVQAGQKQFILNYFLLDEKSYHDDNFLEAENEQCMFPALKHIFSQFLSKNHR